MNNLLRLLLALLLLLASTPLWALCRYLVPAGPAITRVNLPATLEVPRDALPGAEIWSTGGWTSPQTARVYCDANAPATPPGVTPNFGVAVPGYSNSDGVASVYATNIEGVGISVYWCDTNLRPCPADYRAAMPVRALYGLAVSAGRSYTSNVRWWVRLVKTGPLRAGGSLQVGGMPAAVVILYDNLEVAHLVLDGNSVVAAQGCEVNPASRTINVPLPDVRSGEFPLGTGVLADTYKARSFAIYLRCDPGVKVYYQIDGSEASSGSNVLANATGAGMASGVGVQLFRGNLVNAPVQELGQRRLFTTTGGAAQDVNIVLAARYFKTAAQVTGGQVAATATFTLSYE
ncbi:fimbrial protein [Pseudomonas citronellolis]|uniref:fimbrial protein n=1 Tax=Pseudomonas citronellolis TaxID=53408 RepID=UPI0023E413F0|nr:fimbrial protein [Pseudomonas citronellolis]MDF3935614.1 fimbrial protein [Pseudomonas citronellolis]